MRALVTGGAGFLGAHLVEDLLAAGHEVTVLDDLSTGSLSTLAPVLHRIRFRVGSVAERAVVEEAMEGCRVAYHLASTASVPASLADPGREFAATAVGMLSVLEAARGADLQRVILASSGAVYGSTDAGPAREEEVPRPVSPYGASKLAAEVLARTWSGCHRLPVTVLRLFNTYGPRQPRYLLHDLYRKLEQDPAHISMLGTGEERRDLVYLDDTVAVLRAAATHPGLENGTFNVGTGRCVSVREVVERVLGLLGRPHTTVTFEGRPRPGDPAVLHADPARLQALGLAPRVPLEEGLAATLAWFGRQAPGCPSEA